MDRLALRGRLQETGEVVPEDTSQDHHHRNGEKDPIAERLLVVEEDGTAILCTHNKAGSLWICCSTGPAILSDLRCSVSWIYASMFKVEGAFTSAHGPSKSGA